MRYTIFMLAKLFRFHGHQAVRRGYRQGSSVRGSLGSLHVHDAASFKAAVVVSKKVDKSAVTRNRIRRRVYEQLRLRRPEMGRTAELIVTVYQVEAATMPAAQLKAAVDELLQRAKLL